jgi:hypothetical protein
MAKLGGRPRKAGERYPSGDLKKRKPGEAISPSYWGRIKNYIAKLAKDERLESEVGRLSFAGEFTNAQTAAAFKVGDVYRAYHRANMLREHARAPNWERGYGSADLAIERMTWEQLEEHEAWVRKAYDAWKRLDEYFVSIRRDLRQAMMDVCVYGTPTNPLLLPELRGILDDLAKRWEEGWKGIKHRDMRVIGGGKKTEAVVQKRPDSINEPLDKVVQAIRPDLDTQARGRVIETFHALRARRALRLSKESSMKKAG